LQISWTTLLCRLMHNLCMCGSVQHSNICNHVSGYIILHKEQLILGKSSFQNRCFLAFPMYCPYLNFRNWVICASMMVGFVQKLLEILLSIRHEEPMMTTLQTQTWTHKMKGVCSQSRKEDNSTGTGMEDHTPQSLTHR
jgi:hypothetical protein